MRTRIPRPPRWRAPFLRALAKTGNVTLSCEQARVHHSHIYRLRRKDKIFATDMDKARAQAVTHLAAEARPSPVGGLWHCDGGELVITSGRNGAPRRTERARPDRWSRADEKRFLDTLATTCNVTLACESVGRNRCSAYARRQKWGPFAKEWAEALKIGLQVMELRLLQDSLDQLDNYYVGIPREIRPGRYEDAIRLMAYHHKYRGERRTAWNTRPVDVEAVKMSIIRKAEALEAVSARKKAKVPLWE